ncbi:MAG: hypothetical protein PUK40_02560 [Actinomycetaceae bacterium]|nr:hypothetical protein [Arcanobacterium sp.]MDD7504822.1 hypothetical protein [Actinomycetaceae bacterium]MDY6143670.1 hypothetical protein [Arcanobacterium sp.]
MVTTPIALLVVHVACALAFYCLVVANAAHDARTRYLYTRLTNYAGIVAFIRLVCVYYTYGVQGMTREVGTTLAARYLTVNVILTAVLLGFVAVAVKRGILGRGDFRLYCVCALWAWGTHPGNFVFVVFISSLIHVVVMTIIAIRGVRMVAPSGLGRSEPVASRTLPFAPQIVAAVVMSDVAAAFFSPLFLIS